MDQARGSLPLLYHVRIPPVSQRGPSLGCTRRPLREPSVLPQTAKVPLVWKGNGTRQQGMHQRSLLEGSQDPVSEEGLMFNFIRFAQEHRIQFLMAGQHHHATRDWLQTHCPQCTDGSRGYHLGWNAQKGYFHCWRCGSVRRDRYVQAILHITPEKARSVLHKYDDGARAKAPPTKKRKRMIKHPPGTGPLLKQHKRYLLGRGFDPKELRKTWDLQGVGPLGPWQWRVVFPICNREGLTVAWGGRTIVEGIKQRYRVTEDEKCLEDPKGFLYGIHKVDGGAVIVVEGPGDVWNLGEGAVATLGSDWRMEQANKLREFTKRYIMYDSETLAQKRAQALAEWLGTFPGETELITGHWKDPGEISKHKVRKIRKLLLGRFA